MSVIRQPSATVEVKEGLQPDHLPPRNINLAVNGQFGAGQREVANPSPDYQEELKEAGIISKKFILELEVLPRNGHPVLYPEMREERQCLKIGGTTPAHAESQDRHEGSTQNTIHEQQSRNGEERDMRILTNSHVDVESGNGGVKVAAGKPGEGFE